MADELRSVTLPADLADEIDELKQTLQMNSRREVIEYLYTVSKGDPDNRPPTETTTLTDSCGKHIAVYCLVCDSLIGEMVFPEFAKFPWSGMYSGVRVACVNCSIDADEFTYRYGSQLAAVPTGVEYQPDQAISSIIESWEETLDSLSNETAPDPVPFYSRMVTVIERKSMEWVPDFSPLLQSDSPKVRSIIQHWMKQIDSVVVNTVVVEPESESARLVLTGSDQDITQLVSAMNDDVTRKEESMGNGREVVILA